jgi:hypothetical protein
MPVRNTRRPARRAAGPLRATGLACAAFAVCLSAPAAAFAGAPFITDDPGVVDRGRWEISGFSSLTGSEDGKSGVLGGVDVNYGASHSLQLHLIAPIALDEPAGGRLHAGLGDIELGFKYHVFDPHGKGWSPEIGLTPLVVVPTGKSSAGLGAGHTRVFLPLWAQKDFGPWTTYGGGGYWFNPGPGNENYWFAGWVVQRQIAPRLTLGGEAFYQTRDTAGGRDAAGFNIGVTYDLNEHYHLLFSAGRGLQNVGANQFSYYV